ncbi:hypothetical protein V2J09_019027 [Rumex salicifolius]
MRSARLAAFVHRAISSSSSVQGSFCTSSMLSFCNPNLDRLSSKNSLRQLPKTHHPLRNLVKIGNRSRRQSVDHDVKIRDRPRHRYRLLINIIIRILLRRCGLAVSGKVEGLTAVFKQSSKLLLKAIHRLLEEIVGAVERFSYLLLLSHGRPFADKRQDIINNV